jgi:hypothetical protein
MEFLPVVITAGAAGRHWYGMAIPGAGDHYIAVLIILAIFQYLAKH